MAHDADHDGDEDIHENVYKRTSSSSEKEKKMSPLMAAIAAKKLNSTLMRKKNSSMTMESSKDVFGLASSLMGVGGVIKKLKKKAAKPSWYSQYKEHFAYEHRIHRDGFEFIFEYKAHFGNTLKDFFPTQVMDVEKTVIGISSQIAFISLDKNGFNYWETSSSENRAHMTKKWR